MEDRNQRIVADYRAGMTLQAISEREGISRERVRQIIARLDPDAVASARAARRKTEEKPIRPAGSCAVCGKPLPGNRRKTCSPDCSEFWRKYRRQLDRREGERHNVSQAKAILKHPEKYNEYRIAWARRVLEGQ